MVLKVLGKTMYTLSLRSGIKKNTLNKNPTKGRNFHDCLSTENLGTCPYRKL